jgi:CubicO group peptidase (beta-lactamase class C family)
MLRLARASIAVIVLLTVVGAAQTPDVARLDQIVQGYVQRSVFMGAVLVAQGDEVVLNKGYGSANLEWNIPNTPTTKFRLGSITKQFTAASILLLEQRGMLKIDDPVKTYVKDAPASWDPITIRHLLTHTSGLFNFTSLPGFAQTQAMPSTPEQSIAKISDRPLDFPPGEKMSYSNTGYIVLGYIIEKLTGQMYGTFVEQNIFTPLGMKDSGYDSNTALIPRRASGYTPGPNGPTNSVFSHMSVPHAAGGLYSTTEDLLRWERALFGGKVVSADALREMTTPVKNSYAFGLVVREINGRKEIWHNGGISGFNTSMSYYPASKITVIVLGNLNGRAPDELCAALGAAAHGDAPTK